MTEGRLAIGEKTGGGWGHIPFSGGDKAHHWRKKAEPKISQIAKGERVTSWIALCGLEGKTYKGVPMINQGDFDQCKRCQNKLRRR